MTSLHCGQLLADGLQDRMHAYGGRAAVVRARTQRHVRAPANLLLARVGNRHGWGLSDYSVSRQPVQQRQRCRQLRQLPIGCLHQRRNQGDHMPVHARLQLQPAGRLVARVHRYSIRCCRRPVTGSEALSWRSPDPPLTPWGTGLGRGALQLAPRALPTPLAPPARVPVQWPKRPERGGYRGAWDQGGYSVVVSALTCVRDGSLAARRDTRLHCRIL